MAPTDGRPRRARFPASERPARSRKTAADTWARASDDDRARQTLTLAADGALGEGLTLSINAGASFFWSEGDAERDRQVEYLFIPTLTVDVTETTSAYVGYAGFYSDDSQRLDAENTNVVEAGVTVLATSNTQLDVNGGLRVDDNVDSQFFLGIGLAQRF